MRKILFALAVLALVVSATVTVPTVAAQSHTDSASSGPPPVIQIYREEVKPGKGPLHSKTEAAFVAAYKKANLKYYYLGTTSMTGPSEAWFLSAYASMEDVEKANLAFEANKAVQAELDRVSVADGDLLTGVRSTYLFYNKELSYRPDFNLGEYKYFMVDTYRIKLGHGEKFAEMRKAVNAGHEKANIDEHMLVYNVGLGAPAGTVMVFQPVKSLKEFDEAAKTHGKGSAYYEAIGDAGRKMFAEFAREDEQFFVRDFLAISPGMSFVSEKVIASNPSFWKPKTEMAKAPAAKKEPAKIEKK
ncbi:MAG: hypothetical protein ABSG52_00030 [Terriglobales bacterium]|jgi:hypothetical protein